MKKSTVFGALAAVALSTTLANAGTLDDVKARGELNCGVTTGLAGFSLPDASGNWTGLDVDLCRAVASAVLGDAKKVKFVPLTSETRFTALSSGEVDLLARTSTWTYSRDTDLKLDFVAVNYYDGQGFLVKKSLGVDSAKKLDGATICIQIGTTGELNTADFFKQNGIKYTPVPVADDGEAQRQYEAGKCDSFTTDSSALASARASMSDPSAHVLLPEIISKEPLGPVVRHGDNNWGDIVRWSHFAMLIAEEKGLTKANVDEMAASTVDPEVKRLLGAEGEMGKMMGLDNKWGYNIVKQVGNYGEAFEANVGAGTKIGLARGLNALWSKGGLQYAAPLR
jgi:general L-amino acid transport system substrate-binding protein